MSKKIGIKIRKYSNATTFYFNKRHIAVVNKDDYFIIEFKRPLKEGEHIKESEIQFISRKMLITSIGMSREAAECLLVGLANEIGYKINY